MTTTTHAGMTLREGVAPEDVVDRRPIAYVNCSRSELWRGDDPEGWLEQRIENRVKAGAQRIGLHLPGEPLEHTAANVLDQWYRLHARQAEAIVNIVRRFRCVSWSVNVGGWMDTVIPERGWDQNGEHFIEYRRWFERETAAWALALGHCRSVSMFADGLGVPEHYRSAMHAALINYKLTAITDADRFPQVRLGSYIPEYGDDGKSRPDGAYAPPIRLITLRHIKQRLALGRLDLDHLDTITRETHCWLNGQWGRIQYQDGDHGYREIDDPLLEELAERGWVFSVNHAADLPRAIELSQRGAGAAVKLLEQRRRDAAAAASAQSELDAMQLGEAGHPVETSGTLIAPDVEVCPACRRTPR